ncbi:MAG TPA: AI-2E family transporter [Rhodothermales bacterium]|nr:AI-2E family transporter [Rhodothermales bacterium]
MRPNLLQHIFFFALLALTTLVFYHLIEGFMQPIFWAAVLGVIFRPVRRKWLRYIPGHNSIASFLTVIVVVLTVVLPLFLIGMAVTREALTVYQRFQSGELNITGISTFFERMTPEANRLLEQYGVDVDKINEQVTNTVVSAGQYVASQTLAFGQRAFAILGLFFLMLYLLFFFIRDGDRILEAIIKVLPLGDVRERRLFAKFAEVSRATLKGTLVVAVLQGGLGGIIFWILGITAPVLWGVVMTFMSLLPAVGSAIVWVPVAIVLFATGHVIKGVLLILFGTFIIGLVDNILRPILVGHDTKMPDYLVLLATLGGLTVFGLSGFIIGPVIAALFLVLWDMFQEQYSVPENPKPNPEAAKLPSGTTAPPPLPDDELAQKELPNRPVESGPEREG